MATSKANITGLVAVPLMLLTLQQVFEADRNRDASAQGFGRSRANDKNDKIEPKPHRPWEAPILVPHLSTELSVHGIATTDVAHVWIVGQEGG